MYQQKIAKSAHGQTPSLPINNDVILEPKTDNLLSLSTISKIKELKMFGLK